MENGSQVSGPGERAWKVRSRMSCVGALAEALSSADRRLVAALVKARELNHPELEAGLLRLIGDLETLVAGLEPAQFFQAIESVTGRGVVKGMATDHGQQSVVVE